LLSTGQSGTRILRSGIVMYSALKELAEPEMV